MCGIVGYTGHREASDILLRGLKSLEYRGYEVGSQPCTPFCQKS